METPKCYYSFVQYNDDDINNWSVIVDGMPICSKRTFPEAVRCAKTFDLTPSEYFWNGVIGQFVRLIKIEEVTK